GLHRASPSATLDKSGQSLLIQLSQWPLLRPVLATIVKPRGRYVEYFFATAGSLVGNTPPWYNSSRQRAWCTQTWGCPLCLPIPRLPAMNLTVGSPRPSIRWGHPGSALRSSTLSRRLPRGLTR